MNDPNRLPTGRPLLVIAHPGHELRVHHWCELARPDVAVLTDGSGADGASRVYQTTRILTAMGARPSSFYGPVTDRQLYEAVLRRDLPWLQRLVEQLAGVLIDGGYDYVVGDAPEGQIMGHDLLRGILDAALSLARRETGAALPSYDFPLEADPGSAHPELMDRAVFVLLDEAAVDRKLRAGMSYDEIRHEVVRAVETYGRQAFAVECLRPSLTEAGLPAFEGTPGYERHGEQQVAKGRYPEVVRHSEHVGPLIERLRAWAASPAAGVGAVSR